MYDAPVIKKAFDVLGLIVEKNRSLGVTEISKTLALSKSTVFGILKSLQDLGFITKSKASKRYAVGPELFRLSKKVLQGGLLTAIARPYLEKLAEEIDESVFFCIKEKDNDIIKVFESIETGKKLKISSPVGTKLPITSSVLGKVFLSPMKNEDIRSFLVDRGLPKYTKYSITDIDKFIEEIEKTRQKGYGIDLEEYLIGVRALAALVNINGAPTASVCIMGFAGSMKDNVIDDMAQKLVRTAQEISKQLS